MSFCPLSRVTSPWTLKGPCSRTPAGPGGRARAQERTHAVPQGTADLCTRGPCLQTPPDPPGIPLSPQTSTMKCSPKTS